MRLIHKNLPAKNSAEIWEFPDINVLGVWFTRYINLLAHSHNKSGSNWPGAEYLAANLGLGSYPLNFERNDLLRRIGVDLSPTIFFDVTPSQLDISHFLPGFG